MAIMSDNPQGNASTGKEIKIDISMKSLGKWLPIIAIILIITLSMYIRLFGFYEHGWPYLRNIDSFYFMREMGEVIDHNGIIPQHDDLRFAPNGVDRGDVPDLYTYIGAYSYMFFRIFMPNMELWQFLIWFPALLASLIAIPSYFIGKCLFDKKAGVLTAIFMVFAIPFVSRTLGGDPDSDAIVMLMLISSIAAYLVAYKNIDKTYVFAKKNIIYSAIAGFFIGLFALTWVGYWFSFVIIVGFIFFKILTDFLLTRKYDLAHLKGVWNNNKSLVFSFVIIMIVFYILTVPILGPKYLTDPISRVFGSFGEASAIKGETEQFPNVFVSVAELQSGGNIKDVAIRASSVDLASQISGVPIALLILMSPFLLTIMCFTYLFYAYVRRREHFDTLLFMLIWFIGFLVASAVAMRFNIFLTPVYAICSAIFLSKLWDIFIHEKIYGAKKT